MLDFQRREMGAFSREEDEVDGATRTMDSHKYTDTSLQARVVPIQQNLELSIDSKLGIVERLSIPQILINKSF